MNTSELELLYEKIYPLFGSKLAAHLVEANIVLTLAGARGYTEFFAKLPERQARKEVAKINRFLPELDIRLSFIETIKFSNCGMRPFSLSKFVIENLVGYEVVSRQIISEAFFFGLRFFNRQEGWQGKDEWVLNLRSAIEGAKDYRKICNAFNGNDILRGLLLGYPLIAILDVEKFNYRRACQINCPLCAHQKILKEPCDCCLACADIPEALLYGGEMPNFFFSKAHWDHPKIKAKIEYWRKILAGFYESDWHKKISQNRNFIKARQVIRLWRGDISAK